MIVCNSHPSCLRQFHNLVTAFLCFTWEIWKVAVSERFTPPPTNHVSSAACLHAFFKLCRWFLFRSSDALQIQVCTLIFKTWSEIIVRSTAPAPNEWAWLCRNTGTKPEKCIVCLQALFLYQLMVMGMDQLYFLLNSLDNLGALRCFSAQTDTQTAAQIWKFVLTSKTQSLPSFLIQSITNDS